MTNFDSIIVGAKFDRWTVNSNIYSINGHRLVSATCDCGNRREVRAIKLINSQSRSCGCLRDEELTIHGMAKRDAHAPEYAVWNAMVQRTSNPNNRQYPDYGARGIHIIDKWKLFSGFIEDMGTRPTPLHSIDRINNNLSYSKENCEWSLRVAQNRNKRNNHLLTLNNMSLCVSEWAEKLGCSPSFIANRIKRGWSDLDVLTKPSRTKRIQLNVLT